MDGASDCSNVSEDRSPKMQESATSTLDESSPLFSSKDAEEPLGSPLRFNDSWNMEGTAGFAMGLAYTPQGER